MGFQQGLSGLNASSKSLDVIGNNIANANTVGFKMAQAQFADVYANALTGGGGGINPGIGTKVVAIAQQFTQGNITGTNNPLDISINGGGFFRMDTNGAITYTRNGQFQLDKNGDVVNSAGAHLTGYVANAQGVLSTGSASALNINTSDKPPNQTTVVKAQLNLDSREAVPGTLNGIPPETPPIFNPSDPTTYNKATSVSVFDSLGNPHVMQTFFVKIDPVATAPADPATAEYNMYGVIDGRIIGDPEAPEPIGVVGFDKFGHITAATPAFDESNPTSMRITIDYVALNGDQPVAQDSPMDIKYDLNGSTQFGSTFSINSLKQDGYTAGKLSKFIASKDGTIVGSYTNGTTNVLGQVVLASFVDPNGLQSLGDNQWAETSTSGPALVGAPNTGNLGALTSSSTEDSNTDLTGELVNMITAQRTYQANAQTIKTQDQVLQTLVNLR